MAIAAITVPQLNHSAAEKIQQNTLSLTLNTTSLSLYPNETRVVEENVTFNGSPVNDAFFYFDTLPEYDLGESAILIAPGQYNVLFRNYSNSKIPPDNYSTNLVVESSEFNATASVPFIFHLIKTDSEAPVLTVYQPIGNSSYSTLLPVNFTASDNVGWRQVEVSFQGNVVFSRLYVGQEFPTPDFFWNKTHIQIATFFRIFPQDGPSTISIRVWDTSFNLAEYSTESTDDLLAPSIEIIRPYDGQVLETRQLTVEWEVTDKSGISSLELLVNDIPFQELSRGTNSADVILPIAEGVSINLTVGIRARDPFNNTRIETIRVEYNPHKFSTDQNIVEAIRNPSLSREQLRLIMLISSIIFVILLGITLMALFYKPKEDGDEEKKDKLKGEWSWNIPNPPLLQILRTITPGEKHAFLQDLEMMFQLENEWETMKTNLENKKKLKRNELFNTIVIFSQRILDKLMEKYPEKKALVKFHLGRWTSFFETIPQLVSPDQVHSFKGNFPMEALTNLLETKSALTEKTERLLKIFEEEWNEAYKQFETQSTSLEEILFFRQEFAAELYLAIQFILNFDKTTVDMTERIMRSIS